MLNLKWRRVLLRLAKVLCAIYLGLLLLVFFFQRHLLYHPSKAPLDVLTKVANANGFEAWQDDTGRNIGWKQINPSEQKHARLLIVHGNGGCAIDRLGYGEPLRKIEPLDVYILEYPGYGAHEGSPSQASFFAAADAAMNLFKKDGRVYVMGESIGTGVAAYLAGTYPEMIKGVLLIAPYDNMTHVSQVHMPIFPVSLLLLDRFNSALYLKNYRGLVAMLFAGQDEVVPNRFGHKLFEGYQGPKKFWEAPMAGHNDLLNRKDAWWDELVTFWNANPLPR